MNPRRKHTRAAGQRGTTLGGFVAGLLVALLASPAGAVELDPQIRAARFEAQMGRPQEALIHLLADRRQGYLGQQAVQADRVLGEMYRGQGLYQRAASVYQSPGVAVADPSWFRLGQLAYRHAQDAAALEALGRIRAPLPPAMGEERLLLEAELLMRNQRPAEAEKRLERLRELVDGDTARGAYARFNLAVVWQRQGREMAARDLLASLGEMSARDAETRALKDKANLTLAYDYLNAGEVAAAQRYFKRARLSGPLSNTALLGLGRTYASQEEYKKALVPWLKLSQRDPADPVVQDALLAVPYAFGKLNAYKQALQYYQQALATLQAELRRITDLEARVKSGAMQAALAEVWRSAPPGIVGGGGGLPALPADAGAPYLWPLFSTQEFQQTLQNVVRLGQSLRTIGQWKAQVGNDKGLPAARREALWAKITELETKLNTLSDALAGHLRSLALQELERRRKRLAGYADEVRFSIAQIYDYAAKRWGSQ